jgi:hypothetical protein
MKISVDDVELYTLSEIQKQVIKHNINSDQFDDEMKRRLRWVLTHKYEQCFGRLKKEWDPKLLANGIDMIPTNPDAYAQLVFSQPNYKDKTAREPIPVEVNVE